MFIYFFGILQTTIIVIVIIIIIIIIIIVVVIIIISIIISSSSSSRSSSSSITIIIIITCEAEDVSIGSSEDGELNQNGIKSVIWQFQTVREFKTGLLACSTHSESKGQAK